MSTMFAQESGATDKRRVGPDSLEVQAAIWLVVFLVVPVTMLVYGIVQTAGQLRRVRPSRMFLWWLVAVGVALAIVDFNPAAIWTWQLDAWKNALWAMASFVLDGGSGEWIVKLREALSIPAALPKTSIGQLIWRSTPMALVLGVGMTVPRIAWAMYRRRALGDMEHKAFDFTRPFGILDWNRRRISRKKIATGKAVSRKRGTVAVGTGRYGEVVNLPVAELQRPTIVLGQIRSGKTAAAMAVIAQAAIGGVIITDFKGDRELPLFWARWAVAFGRKFKHFCPDEKNGERYIPPLPEGVPQVPCCYDPLRSGNADSKTNMLQGSVDREGDAAFYLRSAQEMTLVAYQVAAITGVDKGRSGFQTLYELLDIAKLREATMAINPATGRPFFNENDPTHAAILARITYLDQKTTKDEGFRAAITGTRTLLSSYLSSAAVGRYLRPGDTVDTDINLLNAVLEGHIVVFSLPVQDYKELAKTIGTLVLLDMQNVISSLRGMLNPDKSYDWDDCYLQIEEFGSAGAEAVLDILNKSGDVGIRPLLSTQSWNDLLRMKDGESMASSILDQAGNIFVFQLNDDLGAEKIAAITPPVVRYLPREQLKYKRGFARLSLNITAAKKGELEPFPVEGTQLTSGDLKKLGQRRHHNNHNPDSQRIYECIWVACYDGKRVTHTHKPYPCNWVERIGTVLVDPTELAARFPEQVHEVTPDRPLVSRRDPIDFNNLSTQPLTVDQPTIVMPAVTDHVPDLGQGGEPTVVLGPGYDGIFRDSAAQPQPQQQSFPPPPEDEGPTGEPNPFAVTPLPGSPAAKPKKKPRSKPTVQQKPSPEPRPKEQDTALEHPQPTPSTPAPEPAPASPESPTPPPAQAKTVQTSPPARVESSAEPLRKAWVRPTFGSAPISEPATNSVAEPSSNSQNGHQGTNPPSPTTEGTTR